MVMKASIVIPIYNAGQMAKNSVDQIVTALDPLGYDYEILLRDDGSFDDSKTVLDQIETQYSQVRCFRNITNEGLGATLRKLFHDAKGDHILYCDIDLPCG
jgi:glycosyltransferase involved in cell wall biosynthesis